MLKAVLLERLLLICSSNSILWSSVDILASIVAAYSLYPTYKIEREELKNFKNLKERDIKLKKNDDSRNASTQGPEKNFRRFNIIKDRSVKM